jgi:cytochrome c oxidase cbb3-type subunit 3
VPSTPPTILSFAAVLGIGLGIVACDRAPGGAREWTAADHDQAASPGQAAQVTARPSGQRAPVAAVDPGLIDLAWQRNCSRCHGARGRGDGPEGAMLKSPDLTRADWQAKVTDAELAEVIRKGRNKMPAFDLPPKVIEGLVRRIRLNRAPE